MRLKKSLGLGYPVCGCTEAHGKEWDVAEEEMAVPLSPERG